jgi:bifunctional DNase/RNase
MESFEVKISNISLTNIGFAVFLSPKDGHDDKVVPIFIGPLETHAISSIIEGTEPITRPMTHDLLLYSITALGAKVVKVLIEEIIDNTFYAKITLRKDEDIIVLDSRPSDAIALCLRADAPIYMTRSVYNEASIQMTEESTLPKEDAKVEKVQASLPKSHLQVLEDTLSHALRSEDYETAAKIRDEIKKLTKGKDLEN